MTTLTTEAPRSSARTTARHDCYRGIHKAMRLMLTDTLMRVGRSDPFDDADVTATLEQFDELIELCESHIEHENSFMHPALERARPGSAARITEEHHAHDEALADLRELRALVAASRLEARGGALLRLYHRLALFTAENLAHMDYEETEHNAVLWAHYSDEQLLAIERDLHASIPPDAMMQVLRWLVPALNAPERAEALTGMRTGMPPQAFAAVLDIAGEQLAPTDHAKLLAALEPHGG